ncbi:MAG TPA: hypothetical protein V6D19_22620 [Stenomitos sp.]
MQSSLKAGLVLATLGLISLTACGEEAKNISEGAKNSITETTQKATEGAQKASEAAGKISDAGQKTVANTAQSATEGAQKMADGAEKAAQSAQSKVTETVASATFVTSLTGMKDGVSKAISSVKAGDFKTAQAEVSQLQETWGKIRETAEKHSGANYKTVNDQLAVVQTALKAPSPDKTKILSEFQSLSTAVAGLIASK